MAFLDSSNQNGSLQDLTTAVQLGGTNTNQSLTNLIAALQALFLTRSVGTFTFAAAATAVVLNTQVQANSLIYLMPTNASAGTLVGSAKSPFISARTVGTSFTVSTASGVAATGGESFSYFILSPT